MPFALLEDSFGLRLWYQCRGAITPPQDVVIVALESRSSKALGLSNRPDRWPRRLHAELVRGLTAQGASAVVFDLLFDNRPREPEDDRVLAAALRASGHVLLASYMAREQRPFSSANGGTVVLNTDQLVQPLPLLAQAAYATAPFLLPKTPYGVREFWLFAPSAGDEATLVLQVAALLQPRRYQTLYTQATGRPASPVWTAAQLRQLRAVLPATRAFNLYGPPGTLATLTYDQAMAKLRDSADRSFRGKLVLVGFSESNQPENRDAYVTAFSAADGLDMSGVELMGTAIANVLHDQWLRNPGTPVWMGVLLAFGGLLIFPWFWCAPRVALSLNAVTAALYVAGGAALFAARVWVPLMAPIILQLPVLATGGLMYQQRRGNARLAQLRNTLHRYVPGAALERLLLRHCNPQGEIEVVCLCADIAGYTTLAESMPPQRLRHWLNEYFSRVIALIEEQGGHVVDLTGDAVLALWTATPTAAVACARAVQVAQGLQQLEGMPSTVSRIGIHYGPVSFGEVGAETHLELRAVGDTVNTTSRLQGANKQLGTRVLISDEAARHLGDSPVIKSLGCLQLVGKQQPVGVSTLREDPTGSWEHIRVLETK